MINEFSRIYDLALPSAIAEKQTVAATAEECKALAKRFKILDVKNLSAEFTIRQDQEEGCFKVTGYLKAHVTQACVITLSPVDEYIEEQVNIKIRVSPQEDDDLEGFYDDDSNDDIENIKDTKIDIGELIAQYLALSLDPYPRKDTSSAPKQGQAVKENPFSILSSLTKKDH